MPEFTSWDNERDFLTLVNGDGSRSVIRQDDLMALVHYPSTKSNLVVQARRAWVSWAGIIAACAAEDPMREVVRLTTEARRERG